MKRVHFVGICGVGMSATAILLKEDGWHITGSDSGCFEPIKGYLAQRGIPFSSGYSSAHLPPDTNLVVAGGSAKLDPAQNDEVRAAHDRNIPVKTFPEVLADLSSGRETVLVAGSYGKSTLSSLIARCLSEGHHDPSWFTGAPPVDGGLASHLGQGRFFIIEADEYPTSGLDRRSKFLHLRADNVVLVAAEHDHVNVFPTLESYLAPYVELLARVPASGSIVACLDNPNVDRLITPHRGKTSTYGIGSQHSPVWSARAIVRGETTSAQITCHNVPVCNVTTTLLGDHNIQNIVGAAAFLLGRNILTPDDFANGVKAFRGIRRRLERRTQNSSVPVYEGYGSSVDKARAAILAIEAHFPGRRLVIVFEPHTFSWRNRSTLHWYDEIFTHSALTLVYPPPSIGVASHDQTSHQEIVQRIEASGARALPITTNEEALEALRVNLTHTDVVLILTSGDMGGLVDEIPRSVERLYG